MIRQIFTKSTPVARMTPALELRFAGGNAGEISGYASVFGGPPDSYGDIIAPGAFARTLREMRAEGKTPGMLWSHDPSAPIGRWIELREDDRGLYVRGQLNLDTTRGKDAHGHLKHGDVSGLSIGFAIPPSGKTVGPGGSNLLIDVDLVEISVVAFPANRRAVVDGVKTLQSKTELIDLLREAGLAKAAANRVASGGWPALSGEHHQKAIDLAAEIERATANLRTK